MKKKLTKKLSLNKEKISALNLDEMRKIMKLLRRFKGTWILGHPHFR